MKKTSKNPATRKKVHCTVCPKWEIKRPELCSNTLRRAGEKLYFCTARCKERYIKSPEKFA